MQRRQEETHAVDSVGLGVEHGLGKAGGGKGKQVDIVGQSGGDGHLREAVAQAGDQLHVKTARLGGGEVAVVVVELRLGIAAAAAAAAAAPDAALDEGEVFVGGHGGM